MISPPSREAYTAAMLEIAGRLGVPTFVLVILLLFAGPRLDHAIMVADRVDGELQIIAASCFASGRAEVP